jgi:hypothetical protein
MGSPGGKKMLPIRYQYESLLSVDMAAPFMNNSEG